MHSRFPEYLFLVTVKMGPKHGGVRRGTGQSSRQKRQKETGFPAPAPVPEPVEQSVVGGPSGAVPTVPTMLGDPNFQQTLKLLTQALSSIGQSRDPSLGYADQAKRIRATDFDGDGNPVVQR